MEFQEALIQYNNLLKNNNLPTDKIWLSTRNVKIIRIYNAKAYYQDENKKHATHEGDKFKHIQLNETQKRLTQGIEGYHLFINLSADLPTEADVKTIFKKCTTYGKSNAPVVFYAITIHENKTMCGLLLDWLGEDESYTGKDFHILPKQELIFSANEIWKPHNVSYISDYQDWSEIKALPIVLSNLDYLMV